MLFSVHKCYVGIWRPNVISFESLETVAMQGYGYFIPKAKKLVFVRIKLCRVTGVKNTCFYTRFLFQVISILTHTRVEFEEPGSTTGLESVEIGTKTYFYQVTNGCNC